MSAIEYGGPIEEPGRLGAGVTTAVVDEGLTLEEDEFGITSTGSSELAEAARSPVEAWISATRWSRDDVELVLRAAGTAATLIALYATYRSGH